MGGEAAFRVRSTYHDIVRDRRILFTETIEEVGGRPLGASLVSVEMTPDGEGTRLAVTLQSAGLDGGGLEREVVSGWGRALDSLGAMLEPALTSPDGRRPG